MAIRFIACRNTKTGAVAELPETALPHMTDYVPVDQEQPEPAAEPASASAPRAAPAAPESAKPARKTKAASAATNEEE